jgi:hypothetical protein
VRRDGLRVRRKGGDQEQPESALPLTAPYDDPISYLIAVVSGEIKPAGLSSLDTSVTVIRILDAARESAKTGDPQCGLVIENYLQNRERYSAHEATLPRDLLRWKRSRRLTTRSWNTQQKLLG